MLLVGVFVGVLSGVGATPVGVLSACSSECWSGAGGRGRRNDADDEALGELEVLLLGPSRGRYGVAVRDGDGEVDVEGGGAGRVRRGVAIPRKVFPSPNPEGSQDGSRRTRSGGGARRAVEGPWMLVVPRRRDHCDDGKVLLLVAARIAVAMIVGCGRVAAQVIPSEPLEKMELQDRILMLVLVPRWRRRRWC